MTENNNSKDGSSGKVPEKSAKLESGSAVAETKKSTKAQTATRATPDEVTPKKKGFSGFQRKPKEPKSPREKKAAGPSVVEKIKTLPKKQRIGLVAVVVFVLAVAIGAMLVPSTTTPKTSKMMLSQLSKAKIATPAIKKASAVKAEITVKTKKALHIEIARPGDLDTTATTLARLRDLGMQTSKSEVIVKTPTPSTAPSAVVKVRKTKKPAVLVLKTSEPKKVASRLVIKTALSSGAEAIERAEQAEEVALQAKLERLFPSRKKPILELTEKTKAAETVPVSVITTAEETQRETRAVTEALKAPVIESEVLNAKLEQLFPTRQKATVTIRATKDTEPALTIKATSAIAVASVIAPDEDAALQAKLARLFPNRGKVVSKAAVVEPVVTAANTSPKTAKILVLTTPVKQERLKVNKPSLSVKAATPQVSKTNITEEAALRAKLARLFPGRTAVPVVTAKVAEAKKPTSRVKVTPKTKSTITQVITQPETRSVEKVVVVKKHVTIEETAALKQQIALLQQLMEQQQQLAKKQQAQQKKLQTAQYLQAAQFKQQAQRSTQAQSSTQAADSCEEAGQFSKNGKTWLLMLCGDRVHEIEL